MGQEGPRRPWGPALGCLLWASTALGAEASVPTLAIIIDDMGNTQGPGNAALALPGALTYSFLPHTRFARPLAERAHAAGREVMLHLPMEPDDRANPGPGGLTQDMTRAELERTLAQDLAAVPHVAGVNNHMGSRLTRHAETMGWLMDGLQSRGLYFVDSRTSKDTLAERTAHDHAVPNTRRHVFLDGEPGQDRVRAQWRELLQLVRRQGAAVGIGHPRPDTLAVLAAELPKLPEQGFHLAPASRLTQLRSTTPWHASSSPLLKVAKNSRP